MAEETAAETQAAGEATRNFDLLLDIPLEVTVEIGRTRLAIRDLLQLGPGSVMELAKAAGEPLDVLVNGKPIARGEAVMVNDRFGVRLTDIISPTDRLAGLK
jgi:flagellar motor switch protein FliN/FliY